MPRVTKVLSTGSWCSFYRLLRCCRDNGHQCKGRVVLEGKQGDLHGEGSVLRAGQTASRQGQVEVRPEYSTSPESV